MAAAKKSEESSTTVPIKKLKINIAEIVELAQERFGGNKKKEFLAQSMTTGDKIALSKDPEDYVYSADIQKWWQALTGIIGIPFGRIAQIAGKADSGKSTAAMQFLKAAQDRGCAVVLWDTEGKFDSVRFRDRLGGDPSQILVASSKNITLGMQQVASFVRALKETDEDVKILIVWDSVGSSVNSSESEENDDYSKQPGVTAKENSWAIRRLNQLIEKYRNVDSGKYTIAVLCINQVYANIGSVGTKQKGGGEIEYLSSLILELSRKATDTCTRKGEKVKIGITSRAKVAKNHLFGGEDCIFELDLFVNSSGITLKKEFKGLIEDPDEIGDVSEEQDE